VSVRILHTLSILTEQISSFIFAFQKCVGFFHLLLPKSKSVMSM
jgi:hypothetical protein